MKAEWDCVRLRVLGWTGPAPESGDELITRMGRRYQILEIRGNLLVCLVLPRDAPIDGHVFRWEWSRRR